MRRDRLITDLFLWRDDRTVVARRVQTTRLLYHLQISLGLLRSTLDTGDLVMMAVSTPSPDGLCDLLTRHFVRSDSE